MGERRRRAGMKRGGKKQGWEKAGRVGNYLGISKHYFYSQAGQRYRKTKSRVCVCVFAFWGVLLWVVVV
jgi:hypothetical protein